MTKKSNNMTNSYRDLIMHSGLDFLTDKAYFYIAAAATHKCHTKEKVIRKIYDFYLKDKDYAEAVLKEGKSYEKRGEILAGMRPEDYFLIMAYIDTKLTEKDIKYIQNPLLRLGDKELKKLSPIVYEKFPVEEMKQVIAKKDYHFDDKVKEEMEFTK